MLSKLIYQHIRLTEKILAFEYTMITRASFQIGIDAVFPPDLRQEEYSRIRDRTTYESHLRYLRKRRHICENAHKAVEIEYFEEALEK